MRANKFTFILFVIVYTCKSEPKLVEFKTIVINKTYDALIEVTIDKAVGNAKLSENINLKIEEAIANSFSDTKKIQISQLY